MNALPEANLDLSQFAPPTRKMRGIAKATAELIVFARTLLQASHPMTLRQLHYAIFSAADIAYTNTQEDYKRLSRVTTMARRAYRDWELDSDATEEPANSIPSDWMVDETRNPEMVSVWEDPADYIEAVKNSYRRDNWQDQPNYCEVWSEKGTVLGSIRPIKDEFGVTLRTCHGYGSTGMEQQIGSYFERIDKPITVFYLGDHDPSGHGIESDIHAKVQRASGVNFEIRRLAIHAEDISRHNLPPQKIKATDTRAASFELRFGKDAATVELDALPVDVLRHRIADAVTGLLDTDRWNRALTVQEVEFASIAELGETWKNIMARREGTI